MSKTIKGFIGTLLGVTIGGEAIKSVGNASGFPSGLKSATQSFIGLGIMGQATKNVRGIFKFK